LEDAKKLLNDLNLEKLILWYYDLYQKFVSYSVISMEKTFYKLEGGLRTKGLFNKKIGRIQGVFKLKEGICCTFN